MTTTSIDSNGLDVFAVHPRKGAKYSPNLYRWLTLRTRPRRAGGSRVYVDSEGTLWVGHLDGGELIGQRLAAVLCNGSKADSACWVNLGPLIELEDFWERYMRDGRCAIDVAHSMSFIGEDTRWSVSGDTRRCVWCGRANQVLRRWTEVVVREQWQLAAELPPA